MVNMELSPGQVPNIDPLPKNPRPNFNSVWGKPRAQRTYFFQREDGTIITADDASAWSIYSGKNQVIGEVKPKPKYIGQTDGTTYYKAVMEAQKVFKEKGFDASRDIMLQAEQESFEESKKNTTPPRNFDAIDRHGNPINLRNYGN